MMPEDFGISYRAQVVEVKQTWVGAAALPVLNDKANIGKTAAGVVVVTERKAGRRCRRRTASMAKGGV